MPVTLSLRADDPVAVAVVSAIRSGDVEKLERLLRENPDLPSARIVNDGKCGGGRGSRTLLHIATDWPGHFPNGPAIVALLNARAADLNAPFEGGTHRETPLHWAASSDDVAVLDALLDHGADIEAPGSVIGGGTALADAVAFGQWKAARRLIARGARTTLWQAAALGLLDRVEAYFAGDGRAHHDEITNAFWCACHGGQRETAEYLLARGANLNWVGYDKLTPLDAAARSGAGALVDWLRTQGARSAKES